MHGGILHSGEKANPALYEYIKAAAKDGVKLAACCTGIVVLAELGLLDGKRCAVHFDMEGTMRRFFPAVVPITDSAVVCDGNLITSPGGLAAVNLATKLVADACGEARAQKAFHYLLGNREVKNDEIIVESDPGSSLQIVELQMPSLSCGKSCMSYVQFQKSRQGSALPRGNCLGSLRRNSRQRPPTIGGACA
ncbi:Transcriptional regulator, AraC family (plasmid) [Mesorhizobium loti]|nr:Transcriptional regulator, AraC family [Mesorhizobium loti]